MSISYASEPELNVEEFVDILERSTLAQRRPTNNSQRIAGMLAGADVIVTARNQEGLLVGVSRAISDFHYCTYLSDLAVDVAYQRQGIGKQLIQETHQLAGRQTQLVLLSAPAARDYYPRLGMQRHDSCWTFSSNA
ncbi:MAG: GNAT family N-acetyltransferase [Lacipirellulaceae bacterium]